MKLRHSLPAAFVLAGGLIASASAADLIVQFNGGIGVHPVGAITPGPTPEQFFAVRNDVMNVPPGGRPWVIRKLKANFHSDGMATVRGQGLLFSGGNVIGTIGPVTQVKATLFCGGIAYDTPPMALDAQGDFSFKGQLAMIPPSPCAQPILLIRSTNGPGAWFAAGIPGSED